MSLSVWPLLLLSVVGCFSERSKPSVPVVMASPQIEAMAGVAKNANDKGQLADILISVNGQSSPYMRPLADFKVPMQVSARALNFPYRQIIILKIVPWSNDTSIEVLSRSNGGQTVEALITDLNTGDKVWPRFEVFVRDVAVCLAAGGSNENCTYSSKEFSNSDTSRTFQMSDDVPSYMGLRKHLVGNDGMATTQKLYEGLMTSLNKGKAKNQDEMSLDRSGFGVASAMVGNQFDALSGSSENWGAYPGYGYDGLDRGGEYFHGPTNESRSLSAWVGWFANWGGKSDRKAKGVKRDAGRQPVTAKADSVICTESEAPWCFSQYAVYMDYGHRATQLTDYYYETRLLDLDAGAESTKWNVWHNARTVDQNLTKELMR
jgi:hypothetical protein